MATPRSHILSAALLLMVAGLPAAQAQTVTIPDQNTPAGQPETTDTPGQRNRPQSARRIVRLFDFEERLTNALDVPEGWLRAQDDPLVPRERPDFPIWNLAELDYTVAANGEGSVRCDVEGGSSSLRLKPGMLPIFPLGEYAVQALVRTEGLEYTRPRLVVRALDRAGNPIPGSQRQTILDSLSSEWQPIEVILPGIFPNAAYMQIDLEVVQPEVFQRERLLDHQVWEQDFDGAAWFDDVTVMQVPQLHINTESPLNVTARPDTPTLRIDLRDLAAEELLATTRVYDARRTLVDESTRAVNSGRESWTWTPEIPELGWYHATVEVASAGHVITERSCDFAWLDTPKDRIGNYRTGPGFDGQTTNAASSQTGTLGLQLPALPPDDPEAIAAAMQLLGVQHVTLPVWARDLRAQDVPGSVDRLRSIVTALRAGWIEPRLSLPVVPDELARPLRLRPQDVLDVLAHEPEIWQPYLSDAMDRLGTSSIRWQIGESGSNDLAGHENASEDIQGIRAQLRRFIPGVEIAAGWRLDMPSTTAEKAGLDTAVVQLPAWAAQAPMDEVVKPWQSENTPAAEYVLEPLSTELYTERDVAGEFVRRTVRLWATRTGEADTTSFDASLAAPWTITGIARPTAHPTVAAATWRTLSDQLQGRVFIEEWRVGDGLRCYVFVPADENDEERGGLIVAWREDAPDEKALLNTMLGEEPVTVTDVFGNRRTVEPSTEETHRVHTIPLTPEPIFIENVDTELVRFLAAITLSPDRIQSVAGEQPYEVVISNPWDLAATGRLIITEPGGFNTDSQSRDRTWEITPRSMSFDIPAGESVRLPATLSFSRAIEVGPVEIVFDIQLLAERDYGWVQARVPAEIVLDGISLDVAYRKPEPGPNADLIVEATVTNNSESVRSFDAFAFGPGMPRVRASIGALEPGQSVVRYFPFPKAAAALAGQRVVVSLTEADGAGRLTKGVDVLEH